MIMTMCEKINNLLKENDSIIRYKKCKEKIENDFNLNSLKEEMSKIKMDNCKVKSGELVDKYYEMEKKYKSNVLVNEYEDAKNESFLLLSEIKAILSFK